MDIFLKNVIIEKIEGKLGETLLALKDNDFDFSFDKKNSKWDGILHIFGGERFIEIKRNITMLSLARIAYGFKEANAILLAEYISPQMGDYLVQEDINYIDTVGNMFLRNKNSIILVKNCAKPKEIEQNNCRGRAWTITGLKILFLLLTENDAINWTYRKIAQYSDVSLGSVRYVIADLKHQNIIIELNEQNQWLNKSETIEKWVLNYQDKLLPTLAKKIYKGKITQNMEQYPFYLSGESVANKLNIFQSAKFLAYSFENINECIARNSWKSSENGNIEVRNPFWSMNRDFKNQVPYLLVYADLIAENDARCTEAALEIFHRYLEG